MKAALKLICRSPPPPQRANPPLPSEQPKEVEGGVNIGAAPRKHLQVLQSSKVLYKCGGKCLNQLESIDNTIVHQYKVFC